jgi:hypothetical protein
MAAGLRAVSERFPLATERRPATLPFGRQSHYMKIETQAVHAGRRIDLGTGAVTPPIPVSTTFERHPSGGGPNSRSPEYAAGADGNTVEPADEDHRSSGRRPHRPYRPLLSA